MIQAKGKLRREKLDAEAEALKKHDESMVKKVVKSSVAKQARDEAEGYEVVAIFAAIGEPIGAGEALVIETFARLAIVAGAAVPASLGTLEASHMAIATALGL